MFCGVRMIGTVSDVQYDSQRQSLTRHLKKKMLGKRHADLCKAPTKEERRKRKAKRRCYIHMYKAKGYIYGTYIIYIY